MKEKNPCDNQNASNNNDNVSYSIKSLGESFPQALTVTVTSGEYKDKEVIFYEIPPNLAYFYQIDK